MALIVQKYGGSSVANPEKIKNVAARIKKAYDAGNKIAVVVSAMGDTTDNLISLSERITARQVSREMDMLLATGEQITISLLAMALLDIGVPAVSFTGPQAGILTSDVHCKARIKRVDPRNMTTELDEGKVVVVAGFQGKTSSGEITTLGRGGSDTTAVAIAAGLKADLCEIYTDVNGVYTSDPRIVRNAKKLDCISYDEMLELASLGAKVLHPRSVELAKLYNIPLCVRSSFSDEEGTIVVDRHLLEKEYVVTGVAGDLNVTQVGIFDVPDKPGIASLIFEELAEKNINVDMIVQSAMQYEKNDISFTVPKSDAEEATAVLEELSEEIGFSSFAIGNDVAKVSIVGAGMISCPGVAAKMFTVLADNDINIEMISTSEIKVSCIIKAEEAEKAMKVLHESFQLQ